MFEDFGTDLARKRASIKILFCGQVPVLQTRSSFWIFVMEVLVLCVMLMLMDMIIAVVLVFLIHREKQYPKHWVLIFFCVHLVNHSEVPGKSASSSVISKCPQCLLKEVFLSDPNRIKEVRKQKCCTCDCRCWNDHDQFFLLKFFWLNLKFCYENI